jgi:hypothetical protein
MIRRISKTNPANQVDLFGEEEYEPLRAVLMRESETEEFTATLYRVTNITADELREIAKHLDQVNRIAKRALKTTENGHWTRFDYRATAYPAY